MKTLEQFRKELGEVGACRMFVEEVCMAHLNAVMYCPAGGESLYNPHDYSAVRRVKAKRVVAAMEASTLTEICNSGRLPDMAKKKLEAAPHPRYMCGLSERAVPFIL